MKTPRIIHSFQAAFKGLAHALKTEPNFRFHLLVGSAVVVLLFLLPLMPLELVILVCLIAAVIIIELLNTAVEYLLDLLKPRLHHYVGLVKDVMAGATLVTVITAVIGGVVILGPYVLAYLR